MDVKECIYKIDFNGKMGTGFLLNYFDDGLGVIVTAKHCLKNIEVSNHYGKEYDNIKINNDIKVISVWKSPTNDDIAVLIIKTNKQIMKKCIWEIQNNEYLDTISATMYGFPAKKNSDKPDYCCEFENIEYRNDLNLYIGKFKELVDQDKSFLVGGMSGSPVYNPETMELYGLYLGSQENEYKYDECRIVSIQRIMNQMREYSIIYYKEFEFGKGIELYDKKMRYDDTREKSEKIILNLKKYNRLEFLLVGKSGNGKSSFIKTFLKHAKQISSTGEGRTTRVNCEYHIYYSMNEDDTNKNYVKINFLNKDDFVTLRMKQAEGAIRNLGDNCKVEDLWDSLCKVNAFFDVEEFGSEKRENVEDIFSKIFLEENETIKSEVFNILEKNKDNDTKENNEKEKTLYDLAEDFYEKMYIELNKNNLFRNRTILLEDSMDEDNKEFIELCLRKVKKDSIDITYTGMVQKIEIQDRICDEYARICEELEIQSITFIDTYGLDHQSDNDKEEVKKRLKDLLYNTYPNIKNVLYVRKLNADSPEDLEYYLPTLYDIDSNIVLNIIFTEADKNDNFIQAYNISDTKNIDLLEINKNIGSGNSAVKYFEEPAEKSKYAKKIHPLKSSINTLVKSEAFSNSIFTTIVKRMTPYCANENAEEFKKYFDNNYIKLFSLFKAIIDKEYIGNGIIDNDELLAYFEANSKDSRSDIYDTVSHLLEQLFSEAKMHWTNGNYHRGHWKTKQANIDFIQRRELGYLGVHDDQWSSQFKEAYNKIFSRLSDEDFNKIFLENRNSSQGIAIQKLFNAFNIHVIGCEKSNQDYFMRNDSLCNCCEFKNMCFKQLLLETYEEGELEQISVDRTEWLNRRCNFDERFRMNKEKFIGFFFSKMFFLINQFKEHNNKIVIERLCEDESINNTVKQTYELSVKLFGEDQKKCKELIGDYTKELYLTLSN